MLDDLDKSLRALLRAELPRTLGDVAVTFSVPDETFPPSSVTGSAVNLFLLEASENRDLRSSEPILIRQADGSVLKRPPPVRVDCLYLVTAWARAQDPEELEHRLLGEVMRILLRHPSIPASALQGALKGQSPPVRAKAFPSGRTQSVAELWTPLKGKPRAAFFYAVTISLDLGGLEESLPVVTELSSGSGG